MIATFRPSIDRQENQYNVHQCTHTFNKCATLASHHVSILSSVLIINRTMEDRRCMSRCEYVVR